MVFEWYFFVRGGGGTWDITLRIVGYLRFLGQLLLTGMQSERIWLSEVGVGIFILGQVLLRLPMLKRR